MCRFRPWPPTADRSPAVTVVVGFAPDEQNSAVLGLARLLALSLDENLVVCAVVATPWPSPERVDADYRAYLERAASRALQQARARLPADVDAEFIVHHARSAPTGLLEVTADRAATVLVAGSSSAGVFGHIALGSVTDRLLHSSDRPIALAPRGYRYRTGMRAGRITAAFDGSAHGRELISAAAAVAAGVRATMRVAAFAVRPTSAFLGSIEADAEDLVVDEWAKRTEQALDIALEQLNDLPDLPLQLQTAIGRGRTWVEALEDIDWTDDDLLIVGSSTSAPAARVFLGSHASKLVRHAPVPVVVLPRTATTELADGALHGRVR
jgi:nucleotide-binding universal stress UspA family protein